METLAPTSEQLSRGHWQRPQRDQKTNRTAYRRLSQAEDAHRRGDLDDEQLRAAERLYRHILGAAGCDVRMDEGNANETPEEFSQIMHGRHIENAKAAIGNRRAWNAVHDFVTEKRSLLEIGRRSGVVCHKVNRGVGLGLVISGLDTLAALWGIAQRRPPP